MTRVWVPSEAQEKRNEVFSESGWWNPLDLESDALPIEPPRLSVIYPVGSYRYRSQDVTRIILQHYQRQHNCLVLCPTLYQLSHLVFPSYIQLVPTGTDRNMLLALSCSITKDNTIVWCCVQRSTDWATSSFRHISSRFLKLDRKMLLALSSNITKDNTFVWCCVRRSTDWATSSPRHNNYIQLVPTGTDRKMLLAFSSNITNDNTIFLVLLLFVILCAKPG